MEYLLAVGKIAATIALVIISFLCGRLAFQWMRMYYYLRQVPHVEERWPFSLLLDTWMALRQMDRNLPITAKFFNYLGDVISKIYEEEVTIAYYGPQPFLIGISPTAFEGFDTTATAASYTLYLLGHHSDVQDKVHAEIDAVFADDKQRSVTIEDMKKLKYLDCVIKESLRLYPPVPLVARNIDEDVHIGKHTIPKGTVAVCAIYFLHRHPNVYKEPNTFMPERFMQNDNLSPFAYVPFSAGSRNCIGQRFAQLEEKIMLAHILRNFSVESLVPMDDLQLQLEIVLRPLQGIQLRLTPRQHRSHH
ncbi:hypothetical protein HPB49_024033 [Dermacentor silvarum]|uniref:Uncharacterized protein n=1 Tax=Dermacentor silvarum TaxID=543639 RepID=A0ACB8E4B4_DERSI|nr:hypothetical protein HPB49_024033 [Dermacentor silvarum]